MKAKYDKREALKHNNKFTVTREHIYQIGHVYNVRIDNKVIADFRDPVRAKLLAKALNDAVKSSMKGTVPFK